MVIDRIKNKLIPTCIALALAGGVGSAQAGLVLNATGIADGFSVQDAVTGLISSGSSYGWGPFGLAVASNGSGGYNMLVSDYPNSTLYVFSDSNSLTPASALHTVSSSSSTQGYASLNRVAYGSQGGQFGSFNAITGAFTPFSIAGLPSPYLGMAGDAATGEIISTSGSGLIAINPTSNTWRTVNSGAFGDGVSISPDGKTAYLESGGQILGYNVASGSLVSTSPYNAGSDGTGVVSSSNSLNGDIVVNTNYGTVYLINPVSNTSALIGTNTGQRGDYTAPDISNGTLLMDFSTQIERLSCGANCGIGAPPPSTSVPEPSSIALIGIGVIGMGLASLRRQKSKNA